MRRRTFIASAGCAATWPLAARGQSGGRPRRIGVLLPLSPSDEEAQSFVGAFLQGMQQRGWSIGENMRVDIRWSRANYDELRRDAVELAANGAEVVLVYGASGVSAVQQANPAIPVVFAVISDPVGAGFVDSLARPGGNVTGFMSYEYSLAGKWLQLLKQMSPGMTRVGVIRNQSTPSGPAQFGVIQAMAPTLGVEATPLGIRAATDVARAISDFARSPKDGLIVVSSALAMDQRAEIIALSIRHKLPAIYPQRAFANDGGLMSYAPDMVDQYRRAAGYVDRILKGEKPANLPVQAPTKYALVINLKTARALSLDVPDMLLTIADEVIE